MYIVLSRVNNNLMCSNKRPMTAKIFIMVLRFFLNYVFIFVVCIILSALLLVNNSPHVSKWSSNICKSLFATTEFQHFRLSSLTHVNHQRLNSRSAHEFLKANVKIKLKISDVFFWEKCLAGSRPTGHPLKWNISTAALHLHTPACCHNERQSPL